MLFVVYTELIVDEKEVTRIISARLLGYRKNSKGRVVIVEKYDPDTMVSFTLTSDMKPTDSQLEMIQEASNKPIVYEDDCPELTPQMIEAFKKAANQRNMKLKKAGNKTPELV